MFTAPPYLIRSVFERVVSELPGADPEERLADGCPWRWKLGGWGMSCW